MSDFLTTITNIRNLRIACKELSLKELESAHEKLGEILQERKDEEETHAERERRQHMKQHLLNFLPSGYLNPFIRQCFRIKVIFCLRHFSFVKRIIFKNRKNDVILQSLSEL